MYIYTHLGAFHINASVFFDQFTCIFTFCANIFSSSFFLVVRSSTRCAKRVAEVNWPIDAEREHVLEMNTFYMRIFSTHTYAVES